jgi:hypothetical protein
VPGLDGLEAPAPVLTPDARRASQGPRQVPKQKRTLTNWPAYEANLRQRGSLTVWFTDEAIAAWGAEPRTSRGG